MAIDNRLQVFNEEGQSVDYDILASDVKLSDGKDLPTKLGELEEEIGEGGYTPPQGGIPATDLAPAVQTSLGKAETAYQKPASGIPASDIASGVIPDVSNLATTTEVNQKANAADVYDKTTADGRYVQKESGKGLSSNDYTNADKTKLAGIAAGAEVNVIDGIIVGNTEVQPVNKKVTIPAGQDGKSAYQSYLDTTEDADPLSEEEWVASLHGEDGISVDSDEVVVVHNLNGNPADLQSGQVATLGADMGKTLGDWAKGAMYLGGASGGDEEPAEPEDVEMTWEYDAEAESPNFSIGQRIPGQQGGIAVVGNDTSKATLNVIFYCGDEVPAGAPEITQAFDISKWLSFVVPAGYLAGPYFTIGTGYNGSAATPTGWQTGTYTLTDTDKATASSKPYMVFNFKKSSGTFNDSDLAAIAAGFKLVLEGDPVIPVEPPLVTNKVLSVVNAAGNEVMAMSSPVSDQQVTEVYSKAAVDALVAGSGGDTTPTLDVRRVLRVCHWNVGQFALGRGGVHVGELLSTNYVKKWQNKLRQISADVMLMCEFYTDSNHVTTMFADFPYQNTERKSGSGDYIWSAIMSNIALTNVERVDFSNESSRNFLAATITIGTWSITLIECHLFFAANDNGSVRGAQMQQIINYCANIDRVIICGDFNNVNIAEFDVFKNAGYQMFNRDLYDRVNTYPATGIVNNSYTPLGLPSIAIDNIMCKGLKIVGAQVIDDGTLTDHCGVVCDLILEDLSSEELS